MITKEQNEDIRRREGMIQAWMSEHKVNSYMPEELSRELGIVLPKAEVYEFVTNPPEKYFLYISEEKRIATTWTGENLGSVSFGREFWDNFGGKRVPISVHAINGKTYHGTYFKSAGDYARVKMAKQK